MRYIADHDFHIHTTVSPCCHDDNQIPQRILQYAEENGFSRVCITNHLWDKRVKSVGEWHPMQTFESLQGILPLPSSEKATLLFGAEIDMDYNNNIGICDENLEKLDFAVISTTHLHLDGYTVRKPVGSPQEAAHLWLERLYALLEKDLPWHKIGIAHLTCGHIYKKRTTEVISLLPYNELKDIFSECKKRALGIELNMKTLNMTEAEKDILMAPYFVALSEGCKFYLGSDAHKTKVLGESKANFESITDILSLTEEDKFLL